MLSGRRTRRAGRVHPGSGGHALHSVRAAGILHKPNRRLPRLAPMAASTSTHGTSGAGPRWRRRVPTERAATPNDATRRRRPRTMRRGGGDPERCDAAGADPERCDAAGGDPERCGAAGGVRSEEASSATRPVSPATRSGSWCCWRWCRVCSLWRRSSSARGTSRGPRPGVRRQAQGKFRGRGRGWWSSARATSASTSGGVLTSWAPPLGRVVTLVPVCLTYPPFPPARLERQKVAGSLRYV